jgi:hypothetical protein
VRRNIWIIAVVAAAGAAVFSASCTPQTECDYIDRDVADPLHPTEDDLAYCWQGYDSLGLYAFRFERGNPDSGTENVVFVEDQPNALEPSGAEFGSTWSLDSFVSTPGGPVAILSMPELTSLPEVQVQINQTTMIMGSVEAGGQSALRRAVCRGFGFDTPQKQCRGSASRPQ